MAVDQKMRIGRPFGGQISPQGQDPSDILKGRRGGVRHGVDHIVEAQLKPPMQGKLLSSQGTGVPGSRIDST